MPVKKTIPYNSGTFFITFTCHKWLSLIDVVDGYDILYDWFDILKQNGHYINGFVIMPNHVHAIISFVNTNQSINTIIGNGKRFMAYEIIKRLKTDNQQELLGLLSNDVELKRRENKKLHQVWEISFDWKECRTKSFLMEKLDYLHANPCVKKWDLCIAPVEYLHSSAKYYITGKQGIYPVTNFMEMDDIEFMSN